MSQRNSKMTTIMDQSNISDHQRESVMMKKLGDMKQDLFFFDVDNPNKIIQRLMKFKKKTRNVVSNGKYYRVLII